MTYMDSVRREITEYDPLDVMLADIAIRVQLRKRGQAETGSGLFSGRFVCQSADEKPGYKQRWLVPSPRRPAWRSTGAAVR